VAQYLAPFTGPLVVLVSGFPPPNTASLASRTLGWFLYQIASRNSKIFAIESHFSVRKMDSPSSQQFLSKAKCLAFLKPLKSRPILVFDVTLSNLGMKSATKAGSVLNGVIPY
jgi:hypothetical protein